ncbi:MAG: hypothetical protein FWE44_04150 [Defluviitaleaceae bacterium]|nr:hypothetical protein [Defluviitaleaceae bacterium]
MLVEVMKNSLIKLPQDILNLLDAKDGDKFKIEMSGGSILLHLLDDKVLPEKTGNEAIDARIACLPKSEREEIIKAVLYGGYKYNEYGEACFDADDDDGEDEYYEALCTQEEINACHEKMMEARKRWTK